VRDSFVGSVYDVPIAVVAQWIEDGPTSRSWHYTGPHVWHWCVELSRADRRLLLRAGRRRLTVVESALAAMNVELSGKAYRRSRHQLVREHSDLVRFVRLLGG
jgi:hypothetical protein